MTVLIKKNLFLVWFLFATTAAMGATNIWVNWGGDQNWFNFNNWNNMAVPTSADDVYINQPTVPTANVDSTAYAGSVVIDNGGALNITSGGHLNDLGQCMMGNASAGHITVDGGQLDVADVFAVGAIGVGSTLTVSNGGVVNANGAWLIPGHIAGSQGSIAVTNGGQLNSNLMYVGFEGSGTLDVDAGNVSLTSQLIIGINAGASGTVTVSRGDLICNGLNMAGQGTSELVLINDGKLINHGSFALDMNGTIVFDGGELLFSASSPIRLIDVQWAINHGSGRWDFGSSDPVIKQHADGSISVTATKDAPGDLDGDNFVNEDDLALFANDWLVTDCSSKADFDKGCLVDLWDFSFISSYWREGIETNWHVVQTDYPTDHLVIAPYTAQDFGIVADGITDVTDEIQNALDTISSLGGGTLFLPSGFYKVSGTLSVPTRVILHGDWQKPQIGSPVTGTVLQAYAGRNTEDGDPFIGLHDCSGVKGITIWYPEQLPTNIVAYPPTIQRITGLSQTIENITFVNAYFGFTTFKDLMGSLPFIRNIYGTPLKTGIEIDMVADVGRAETIHFSPAYWKDSGLPNAPTSNQHAQWIYDNGTGIMMRRMDWSYFAYVTVEGYRYGVACRKSRHDDVLPNGQFYAFNLNNCKTGVYFENSPPAGLHFSRLYIQNAQTGLHFSSIATNAALFHTCSIEASGNAIQNDGSVIILLQSCDIQAGTLQMDGGYLTVINSDFSSTATSHIVLNSNVHGASILGNRFTGGAQIIDNTSYPVVIDHTPLTVSPMPGYNYKKPLAAYKPSKPDMFIVTKPPYNAQADKVTDDTAAFQAALTDAGSNGGGVVLVPGGSYRINGTLTIPSGVELRGIYNAPHNTNARGSLLHIYAGRNNANGTPFIQIQSGGGLRGLTFHYPEQIYDGNDPVNFGMVPYPYTIRGLGSDIYVINVSATVSYQFLDLGTYRCDRHYIDYLFGMPLQSGIYVGGGSTDGQIQNCHFNPGAFSFQNGLYESIPMGTIDDMIDYLWRYSNPFIFGNMSGEVLHQNFAFAGIYGARFTEEGGFGPSGHCLGLGLDQCTVDLRIDGIGSEGLDFINTQLVTVDEISGRYIETDSSFNDSTRFFNTACFSYPEGLERGIHVRNGQLEFQNLHVLVPGTTMCYDIDNSADLNVIGGTVQNYASDFHQIESTATADFIGNIINTSDPQMPTSTYNVTSIGNLKWQ